MITIPTLAELYTSILTSLETEFGATITEDGKAELRAQAAVQAGTLKEQYLAIAQTQKNIFVDTCDEETLIRFGLVKLNRQPFAAVAGQYDVTVTGTIGAVIPAQSVFKSDDSSLSPGILFVLDSAHTMITASDTITLRSLTLGIESELEIGDTLTTTAPIPLVNDIVTVTAESVQPLAAETTDAYRAVVINAFRLEAQGGAATDYRIWAGDAQGVAQVYPYARSGYPSEINLYIEATVADSTDGKGTPSQSIIDDVEEVVNFDPDTSIAQNERGRRPLQAIVNYLAITPLTVVVTVTGLQGYTPAVQAQILSSVQTTIDGIRPFVAAADTLDSKNDILNENILNASVFNAVQGLVYDDVTFTVSGISYTTYTFFNGNIPYLNPTIVYA